MFSGTVSLLPGGGGSAGIVSLLPGGGSSTGTATLLPSYNYTAPQQSYSYTGGSYYSYQSPGTAYALPGAGMQAGPFGERGPYTPLDFPLMRELMPGERLENLSPQTGTAKGAILPYLALGIVIALLVR